MKMTGLPGFSAEASLYKSDKVFRVFGDIGNGSSGKVHLAARAIDTFCYSNFCCIVSEGFHWCWEIEHSPIPTR